jgi:nucleotide-binding universal stress UspA family protein
MFSIKTILVTTDFSDFSIAALEYAFSLATVHDASVHLLHVVDARQWPTLRKSGKLSAAGLERAARQNMQQFINETVDEYSVVTPVIRSGIPADEIARYGREAQADLIVIATHGRTGLAHALIGSIAEKVIRCSTVPVFVVKPTAVLEKLITEDDVTEDLHLESNC